MKKWFLCLTLAAALAGCGWKQETLPAVPESEPEILSQKMYSPEEEEALETTNIFLKSLQDSEWEQAAKMIREVEGFPVGDTIVYRQMLQRGIEAAAPILKNLKYNLEDAEAEGEEACVKVRITNTDATALFGKMLSFLMKQKPTEELLKNKNFIEAVMKEVYKEISELPDENRTQTVFFHFKKGDGWKLILDEPAVNALSGGVLEPIPGFFSKAADFVMASFAPDGEKSFLLPEE